MANRTIQEAMTEREQERAIARVVANIDGVSDRIIDGLDEEFSTPMAIAEASPNELQRVDGIGPAIARRIYRRTDSARKHPELHTTDIYGGRRERGFRG